MVASRRHCGASQPGISIPNTVMLGLFVAGFQSGQWHGVISPISLIIWLFFDNVNIYERHSNGGWHNFGFLFGGGARGASSKKS